MICSGCCELSQADQHGEVIAWLCPPPPHTHVNAVHQLHIIVRWNSLYVITIQLMQPKLLNWHKLVVLSNFQRCLLYQLWLGSSIPKIIFWYGVWVLFQVYVAEVWHFQQSCLGSSMSLFYALQWLNREKQNFGMPLGFLWHFWHMLDNPVGSQRGANSYAPEPPN